MNEKRIAVISGKGIDTACGCAGLKLRHPDAQVYMSSPMCVHQTIAGLRGQRAPSEVHVIGMRVNGVWEEVMAATQGLEESGCRVFWHCCLAYNEEDRVKLEELSIPVFVECRTNTEAVCSTLRLGDESIADILMSIADQDPSVSGAPATQTNEEVAFWADYIEWAEAGFFRTLSHDGYNKAIDRLAKLKRDPESEQCVRAYRRGAARYALCGTSEEVELLADQVARCSPVEEPVLLEAETGLFAEQIARLVHEGGRGALGSFQVISCGTLYGNPELAASELFGRVRGSSTGVTVGKAGALTASNGGTVFLDEVGLVPMGVQAKLLRALEDGEVIPEGAGGARPVDARVIAATSLDLAAMVREGYFLEDLFHRLGGLRIVVPPLRTRRCDIAIIGKGVLADLAREGQVGTCTDKDLGTMSEYDWPGNIGQLIKVIKRCVYLGTPVEDALEQERAEAAGEESVEADDLTPRSPEDIRPLREIQREYASRAWKLNKANTAATARILGISRNTLAAYLSDET